MADGQKGRDVVTRKSMRHEGNKNPLFRFYSATYQHSHNLSGSQFPPLENGKNNSIGSITLQNDFMNHTS